MSRLNIAKVKGRCALCRCKAVTEVYSFRVCRWHATHGEDDPPCPYCSRSPLFDPRWTYTPNGEKPPSKVEIRQSRLDNTIFFDDSTEAVLEVETTWERARKGWHALNRHSVVMIGLGQQVGTQFVITQWASDWERELLDAARPSLGLASRVFDTSRMQFNTKVLAGVWQARSEPYWPTVDVQHKAFDVTSTLRTQGLHSILTSEEQSMNTRIKQWDKSRRDELWRANYARVMDSARRIFQIEW